LVGEIGILFIVFLSAAATRGFIAGQDGGARLGIGGCLPVSAKRTSGHYSASGEQVRRLPELYAFFVFLGDLS
jgi:hypothetical protein